VKFRMVQRTRISTLKAMSIRIVAILLALLVAALLLLVMGFNPLEAYAAMLSGAFGSFTGLRSTVTTAVPLIIISLGISIAFSMNFVNVGGEGQLLAGAVGATFIAHNLPMSLPAPIMLLAMAVASMLLGGLLAAIPAFFKAKYNVNETLFTLMLNYVMQYFVLMLRSQIWRDPKGMGFPKIAAVPTNAMLPKWGGIHIGWMVALVLVAIVHIMMRRTKIGYEMRVVGSSVNTARYAGMNVNKVIIIGVCVSGAIAGLTGMIKLSGSTYNLTETIGGGSGFTAVIIAWLSKLSAPVILFVGFMFGALTQGATAMEIALGIPAALADSIQGLILFGALGCEFFIQYKLVREQRTLARQPELNEEVAE
jgi:ABC-type uncharacterized transport system permease subunit